MGERLLPSIIQKSMQRKASLSSLPMILVGWLPSMDGKENFLPPPNSYQFRYLVFGSLLNFRWSTQIQNMNKAIMDWRWKALTTRVDPAQLKMSVTEWLIPRLEIGLLHAHISEKMCNAWLS